MCLYYIYIYIVFVLCCFLVTVRQILLELWCYMDIYGDIVIYMNFVPTGLTKVAGNISAMCVLFAGCFGVFRIFWNHCFRVYTQA